MQDAAPCSREVSITPQAQDAATPAFGTRSCPGAQQLCASSPRPIRHFRWAGTGCQHGRQRMKCRTRCHFVDARPHECGERMPRVLHLVHRTACRAAAPHAPPRAAATPATPAAGGRCAPATGRRWPGRRPVRRRRDEARRGQGRAAPLRLLRASRRASSAVCAAP